MGWNYSREKIIAAFPMMRVHGLESSLNENDESLALFSSMAALGGCDYQLSPRWPSLPAMYFSSKAMNGVIFKWLLERGLSYHLI
mmetsp:Transcript_27841/g.42683  ORF Transcript_27841/g.42683 Transcript_27841/m.42683 type:complete len:85 (+) Transcript_27841:660-914(+)